MFEDQTHSVLKYTKGCMCKSAVSRDAILDTVILNSLSLSTYVVKIYIILTVITLKLAKIPRCFYLGAADIFRLSSSPCTNCQWELEVSNQAGCCQGMSNRKGKLPGWGRDWVPCDS
ncbi:hypothetical protein ATANTOWER_017349 [Ataeniobius toweri]|uniref:Uncharacterized protein n=1 Tax=Ataeniobius toweri TaxID=208326 RepID=A0ABU7BKF6_9TELE|nr:hypothetical protein [Ataeniobius toweri]